MKLGTYLHCVETEVLTVVVMTKHLVHIWIPFNKSTQTFSLPERCSEWYPFYY